MDFTNDELDSLEFAMTTGAPDTREISLVGAKASANNPIATVAGNSSPARPGRAPIEDGPKFAFYSQWARPPYPPGWGPADFILYAQAQAVSAKDWLAEAQRTAQHVQDHPLQMFPAAVDGVLESYDEGFLALIEAVAAGATKEQVLPVIESLTPVLRALPPLLAQALTRAGQLGVQIGFDAGWAAGWKARDADSKEFENWLKKALGAGAGVAIAAVGIALALAFATRK